MIVLVNKKRFTKILSAMLILLLLLIGIFNIKNIKQSIYPEKYALFVEKYSEEYGLDKYRVYSLIKAESNFKQEVVSDKGAVGLMQLMPETAEEIAGKIGLENFSVEKLYEPDTNIRIGCYYLSFLVERYSGDYVSALAAYNAGYGNVDDWLANWQADKVEPEEIPFGETKKYVEKIEDYYNNYQKLYVEE